MPYHELGIRSSNVTSANAALEIIGGTTIRGRLLELGFTLATAVATTLGFGRPAAQGLTPTSPVTLLPEDFSDDAAAATKIALAWATSPTAPANYMRRFSGSAIGQGAIWTFPKGIVIDKAVNANNSLVLFNILGGATLDGYVVIEE
jgi:hypothetical protein